MIQFSVTTPSEVFPFYSCVYILHNYGIILKHNLFIHHLKIKIEFLGLDIEVKSKEKSAPSCK
nr:hypothetical protein [Clostridium gasigenes]